MKIQIKILNKEFYTDDPKWEPGFELPSYATPGSAAMDLRCTQDMTICPGERVKIPIGLAIWTGSADPCPVMEYECGHDEGYSSVYGLLSIAGIILPRSGLGTKGLVLANTVGLIDEDFQGELMISAWNNLPDIRNCERKKANIIELNAGDRIAQLLFLPIIKCQWSIVDSFSDETVRGTGGFGSTDE